MIDQFLSALKASMEEHSTDLKGGDAFLPEYLKGGRFTKKIFPKVARTLAGKLQMDIDAEFSNEMPDDLGRFKGKRQLVDYVYFEESKPVIFFELESLDRAQLYTFNSSHQYKLEYYDAVICKHLRQDKLEKGYLPKYFIWLLILPDRDVQAYPIWDAVSFVSSKNDPKKKLRLINPELKRLIYENPFRFYDNLIKNMARLYFEKKLNFKNPEGKWVKGSLKNFQKKCELIFLTCTGKELILSRGKDLFLPKKEKRVELKWKSSKKH